MPHPTDTPVLDGPRARLRSFAPADVEGRRRCGRDPEIMAMFGGTPDFSTPVPMTVAEAQEWYDEVSADPNPYHWAIEHRGRFVGTTRLHSLRGQDHIACYRTCGCV